MLTIRRLLAYRALIAFMLGHFTVDMFGGLLLVLYPVMADKFHLSNASVGLIALCYTGASSLSQPLFGYLADRYGSRYFAAASLGWSAIFVGLAGLAPNFEALLGCATLAGLGSGAYHPQGASNAAATVGEGRRNTALSIYTVGGTSGYALGPLLGALAFLLFGTRGTLAFTPFGFVIAFAMLRQLRLLGLGLGRGHAGGGVALPQIDWRPLAPVLAVVMLRSWVSLSITSFIPLWFKDQGYSAAFYSALTTLVIVSGAVGTLIGGLLADRYGQRVVLGGSLVVATPCLLLFAAFPGRHSLLLGPLFGFCMDMGLSITLVMAQRLLPGRIGVASGFILGVGFVTGGIGVPATGVLSDRVGVGSAFMLTATLIVAAAALVTRIPRAAMQPAAARSTAEVVA